jgi:outer membrane immunogenic protein
MAQVYPAGDRARAVDLAVMYSSLHSNTTANNGYWMNGGTAELAIPVWRNLSVVGEAGGHSISRLPQVASTGQSLVTGMGGLRLRIPNHTRFQPYAQALAGGAHGFSGYFPGRATSYDTSFAMALGGGVDWTVSRHVWIRLPQADYYHTQFSNLAGNGQNRIRLSAGVVLRFPQWLWQRQ